MLIIDSRVDIHAIHEDVVLCVRVEKLLMSCMIEHPIHPHVVLHRPCN